MTITDEMVGIAENAYDNAIDETHEACHAPAIRAALEAVAPMLIAQGMREAADIVQRGYPVKELLARAQELDPKYPLGGPI